MKKVRFGIIGIGNIGTVHVKNLLGGKVENGVLGAVCDIDPERIKWVHEQENGADVPVFCRLSRNVRKRAYRRRRGRRSALFPSANDH